MRRELHDSPEITWLEAPNSQAPAKLAHTIPQTVVATGLSRASLYLAIGRKELRAVKCGKRTLILDEDLRRFLASLPPLKTSEG